MEEKGTISVHTENIFPIIKKFLYADQEVFLRELIANAVDATQKLKQLSALGKYEGDIANLKISISTNEQLKTLTISDQGLGMTAAEIKEYINQLAFSGATAFVEKYTGADKTPQELIGYFGLGFYSAFMVADQVEIITQSYQPDAEAAHWQCDGSTHFELSKTIKKAVGTDVVLHMSADAQEFLEKSRIKHILNKYCKFLPVPIEWDGQVINDITPIWTRPPQELKDEDYLSFYKALYPNTPDPLLWIHLNVEYPFHLTGVLYFPKLNRQIVRTAHHIQLYARQVFITDQLKDIVPQFLTLLHGVIDSPDIPLNVSRSALQTDSHVRKITNYITKKVADKLELLFKQDRKAFEAQWHNIEVFVKYGMLTEEKFYEKAQSFVLLKNVEGIYATLAEYRAKIEANQTDKDQNLVMIYASEPAKQDVYIRSCQQQGYDVLVLDSMADVHFVSLLEQKLDKVILAGVDTTTVDQLIEKDKTDAQDTNQEGALNLAEKKKLQEIYEKATQDRLTSWYTRSLPETELPVVITIPEFAQRMYTLGLQQEGPDNHASRHLSLQAQATININHPLSRKILDIADTEKQHKLAIQVYDLALLSQNRLHGEALSQFIQRTLTDIMPA
ncbi:MAG: molecular chaperone HtpG [Bacteroidota bacterium]